MSFLHPWFLLLLAALPLVWLIRHRGLKFWKKGATGTRPVWFFANWPAIRNVSSSWRVRLSFLPEVLLFLGLATLIGAVARPVVEDTEILEGEGLDIMICLDMSSSMNAVDKSDQEIVNTQLQGEEPRSRFRIAVDTIKSFVQNRRGDRIGLIVFASDAWLKFPLTLDYQMAAEQIDSLVLDNMERDRDSESCINNCTIDGKSTAVGDALARAYRRLDESDGKGKIIILITDGNDNASKLKPMDVAQHIGAMDEAVRPRLYTFLIGTGDSTRIPAIFRNGRIARENGMTIYQPYESRVDQPRIRQLAEAAKGVFKVSYSEDEFRQNFDELERRRWTDDRLTLRREFFTFPLAAAILLLLAAFALDATVFRRFP